MSHTHSDHLWTARAGMTGLYTTALFARMVPSLGYAGLVLMLAAFLLSIRRIWPTLRRDPFFLLSTAFAGYLVLNTLWTGWRWPGHDLAHWRGAWELFQGWLLFVAAWWIGNDEQRIRRLLLLALAGFLIKSIYVLDPDQLSTLLAGERSGLGMSAIPFALYSATAVLGLVLFATDFIRGQTTTRSLLRGLLWLLCLILALEGTVVAQSRSTWLALLLVLPLLLWWQWRQHAATGRKLTVLMVCLVLIGSLAYLNRNMTQRLLTEQETVTALVRGEFDRVPSDELSSIGVRVHLYRYALGLWRQQPLTGWGAGASEILIGQHPNPELRHWTHLHSSYLEVLVRLGLIGVLFYGAGAWLLLRSLYRGFRSGVMSRNLYLFMTGVFALNALWAVTDFRMIHADWQFYWLLFGGIAYGASLARARR